MLVVRTHGQGLSVAGPESEQRRPRFDELRGRREDRVVAPSGVGVPDDGRPLTSRCSLASRSSRRTGPVFPVRLLRRAVRELLESGPARAGLFFAAGFLVATVLGLALGDLRQGLVTGASTGLVMAVFGYLFVRSTAPADGEARRAE